MAYVDQRDTGKGTAQDARDHGIELEVVNPTGAKRGFVQLPRLRAVERSFARGARLRRLAKDDERLLGALIGPHFVSLPLHEASPLGQVHNAV